MRLQVFVGQIDEELLNAIDLEGLETGNIQDSEELTIGFAALGKVDVDFLDQQFEKSTIDQSSKAISSLLCLSRSSSSLGDVLADLHLTNQQHLLEDSRLQAKHLGSVVGRCRIHELGDIIHFLELAIPDSQDAHHDVQNFFLCVLGEAKRVVGLHVLREECLVVHAGRLVLGIFDVTVGRGFKNLDPVTQLVLGIDELEEDVVISLLLSLLGDSRQLQQVVDNRASQDGQLLVLLSNRHLQPLTETGGVVVSHCHCVSKGFQDWIRSHDFVLNSSLRATRQGF
mmetsp:Transcript_78594/g.163304  ORF Transcript_78594/g.163304 Transcript_78594/m.163304 type:complete len:284 (-) Transcript_78594:633-1484(-)